MEPLLTNITAQQPSFSVRRKAWFTLVGVLAACALVYIVNPSEHSLIPCWFYSLTGYKCAGCGLTRATHQLMHGHAEAAWSFNPFVFVVLPLLAYTYLRFVLREFFNKHIPTLAANTKLTALAAVILVLYTVLRNLPY